MKAAVTAGSCTRLTSLTVMDIGTQKFTGDPEKAPSSRYVDVNCSKYLISSSLKCLIPSDGKSIATAVWRLGLQLSGTGYWLLILTNPLLEYLYLHHFAWFSFNLIPEQFMYDTLAPLTNLSWLKNYIRILRLQKLLELLPNLCHYSCGYIRCGFRPTKRETVELSHTFPQLKTLELEGDQATPSEFFNLLEFLPNLEKLILEQVWDSYKETPSSEDAVVGAMARIGERPILLKVLCFTGIMVVLDYEEWEHCVTTVDP